MKIGIDISQAVYQGSGVAVYTRHLVKSLLGLNFPHAEYVLFGSTLRRQNDLNNFISELPLTKNYITKFFSFPPTTLEFIWNRMHAISIESFVGNVDIFHTSDWIEPPARVPKVTTIHDLIVYKYPDFLNQRIIETQKLKLTWVKKETSVVITDSLSTKRDIIEFLNISESKIQVIYLGIDKNYSPQPLYIINQIKKKYKIYHNYLLCVGTNEPRKNFVRVIQAFKKLNKKDLQLIIVGNFGWGNRIEESKNIKILRGLSIMDLASLYSGAVCFVYPSLYEGFGLPVLEAMACGCPVITSARGSLAEITQNKAILVDPESDIAIAEGIESIIDLSFNEREKITAQGVNHSKKFLWQKTAAQTLKIYQSIVSS